ncbi:MAG: hypothetical protein ACRDRL_24405 [Sciscionella sp.]
MSRESGGQAADDEQYKPAEQPLHFSQLWPATADVISDFAL